MKFIFRNQSYYNYYRATMVDWPPSVRTDIKEELNGWTRLLDILEEKFPSIVFSTECSTDFKFEDKADEAAFILWSNDGVDI